MPLDRYADKRDFSRTPEPAAAASHHVGAGLRYVIHKHAASRLHYDLRLELHGVLLSWAVPKGPSLDPHDKRLAVHVEDHPLDYGDFEGVIPAGEYGAGTVEIWDRGTWQPLGDADEGLAKGELKFVLLGEKLRGRWVLVRMKPRANERAESWLLIKESDAHGSAVSETAAMPEGFEPALATLVDAPPAGDDWLHEVKYDGYRAAVRVQAGLVRVLSRGSHDWTDRFGSVATAARVLAGHDVAMDGEVVVLRPDGVSDFGLLQEAIAEKRPDRLVYMAFDITYLDGRDLRPLTLAERKSTLAQVLMPLSPASPIRYADHVEGGAAEFHRQACALGLEGVISKRASSSYTAGRTRDWLKTRCMARQEFVIGGWTDPAGARTGFGALLLGRHTADGLEYVGRVGSGFRERSLTDLAARLAPLERHRSAFARQPSAAEQRGVHWAEPQLVAEVAYKELSRDGRLRQAVFVGLREDKPAEQVVLETPTAAPKAGAANGARMVSGVRMTHPEKVLYPDEGITKGQLAAHYQRVSDLMLPHVRKRPLSMLRCLDGVAGGCFFHKHAELTAPAVLHRLAVRESGGTGSYLSADDVAGLIALAQMDVLEVHTWGSRADDIERPDRLTFDLDPGEGLAWSEVVEAARLVRQLLDAVGLAAFAKLTGGSGVHVVVPLVPERGWDDVSRFTRAVAQGITSLAPDRYTVNMRKEARAGKVYVDYLRNTRGATAVEVYSTRARPGAPVATPVRWDELGRARSGTYTVRNIGRRLAALHGDPWDGYFDAARPLTAKAMRELGVR